MLFKTHTQSVKEFMLATGQYDPVAEFDHKNITEKELNVIKLRLSLVTEEVLELYQAVLNPDSFACTEIEGLFKHIQDITKSVESEDLEFDKVEVADALTDIDYINTGSAIAFNVPLEVCFQSVHENNMTKVDPITGLVKRSPEGKILKPDGFIPVDLNKVLTEHNAI